jgi:hypothetical protein
VENICIKPNQQPTSKTPMDRKNRSFHVLQYLSTAIAICGTKTESQKENHTDTYGVSNILWHVDPLLGNDNKISNYTTDVAE